MTEIVFPNPGNGYTIREYLGGGNWKKAFRATSPFNLSDVALLYFHDDKSNDVVAHDVFNLLRTASAHPYAGYIAEFKGVHKGDDGKIFLIEEFLARPLDKVGPVNDLTQFVRIARDLSRGLVCLHHSKLIHRDIKLDNCGLDHQQRAKIFDLGSVTSELGEVRGTILTRAPELFQNSRDVKCTLASDVWALGATLYALRSGEYPFVYKSEIIERRKINEELRTGLIDQQQADAQKAVIDAVVNDRVRTPEAKTKVKHNVHQILRGRSEEILWSMLNFSPNGRKAIESYDAEWSALALELGGAIVPHATKREKWEQILLHLRAADRKELVLTRKQLDRLVSEYEAERKENRIEKNSDLENVVAKIRNFDLTN